MPRPVTLDRTLVLPLLAVLALPGCAVHTPSGSVVIDPAPATRPAGGPGHGPGTFCPPGQAKKGHC